jgi:TonB-linked SusC/RagA family outer membrane protein
MNGFYRRILTGLLILAAFSSPALARQPGSGITISRDGASLPDLFMEIHNQTGYFFYYNEKDLAGAHKVNIHVVDAALETVLDLCFANQPIRYELQDRTIIVKLKNPTPPVPAPLPDIRGTVKDDNGQFVEGATVAAGDHATSTDKNGYFELHQIPAKTVSIAVSSVGYESQTIPLSGRLEFTIVLKKSVSKLDDVQVIAYGTTTERLNTGNVSTVKAETIARQPVSNPLAALEGRVPGVYIQQNTGVPGGGFNVMIRGQNSLRNSIGDNGNLPLYIIDGVPYTSESISSASISTVTQYGSPLSAINPGDIESINVLKDADATAIYGSRGANGVILIETKKGRAGKTKVEFNGYGGIEKVTRMMDLLNTSQYLEMRHEAFANDGQVPGPTTYDINGTWDTSRYTNWQKDLIGGTAHIYDGQIGVSGGAANTQFLAGAGFHREGSVFQGNYADQKISAHLNLNHKSENQRFIITISSNFIDDNNNLPNYDVTSRALTLAPDAPALYDQNGNLNWEGSTWVNPLSYVNQIYTADTKNLIASSVVSYRLLRSLKIKVNLGYTNLQMEEFSTNPLSSLNPAYLNQTASASKSNSSYNTWIIEPQVEYQADFKKAKWNLLLGSTFQQSINSLQTINGSGYTSDALLGNFLAAPFINILASAYDQYKYTSFYGRINYNFDEKYLINISGRQDGSSRFGPGNRFATFGAVSAGWIFSKESLFKKCNYLSFGKIRASYGTTGSDLIHNYGYFDSYSSTNYPYDNVNGLVPTQIANANYQWETNTKFEMGVELGFLKDRILLMASWYDNHSSNQLVGYPLSPTAGFPSVQYNLPAVVRNSGIEFDLSLTPVKKDIFSWTTSLNLSLPSNKLLSFPNIEGSSYANTYVVGKSLFIKNLYNLTGVDAQTGVYSFKDVNKDNAITTPEDLLALKKTGGDAYGGFQNVIRYKGFEISFLLQFVKQSGDNYMFSFAMPGAWNFVGSAGNQPVLVLDRWQSAANQKSIQQFSENYGSAAASAYSMARFSSDYSISDASFIRLKNLSLSYRFPVTMLQKLHFQSLRIYVLGQNLFTLTRYLGLDPETLNGFSLPPLKVLTMGIQFNF